MSQMFIIARLVPWSSLHLIKFQPLPLATSFRFRFQLQLQGRSCSIWVTMMQLMGHGTRRRAHPCSNRWQTGQCLPTCRLILGKASDCQISPYLHLFSWASTILMSRRPRYEWFGNSIPIQALCRRSSWLNHNLESINTVPVTIF